MLKMKIGGYSSLVVGLLVTNVLMASPAGVEQSILNAEQVPSVPAPAQPEHLPLTKAEKIKRIKALLKKPAVRAALQRILKHPHLSFTPKSVFTPAGVPMNWGG